MPSRSSTAAGSATRNRSANTATAAVSTRANQEIAPNGSPNSPPSGPGPGPLTNPSGPTASGPPFPSSGSIISGTLSIGRTASETTSQITTSSPVTAARGSRRDRAIRSAVGQATGRPSNAPAVITEQAANASSAAETPSVGQSCRRAVP